MPVFKYRSFEDAEKGLYNFETDDRYYKMVFALNNTIFKKALLKGLPKGVHKYKNHQDAQQAMQRWLMKKA